MKRILLIGLGRWGTNQQLEFPPEEPLRTELAAFISSIEKRTGPLVDGWSGLDAVRVTRPR